MDDHTFNESIKQLEARNRRVEANKAWEISWTRRGVISIVIYICAVVLLMFLGHDGAWKHACVPMMGYVVSTLSLPSIKEIWIKTLYLKGISTSS